MRLPRSKKDDLEKASRLYKAKTGVGCDGFHPKSSFGLAKRNERINCGILGHSGTEWLMAATSTTMFFLIPKNVTSEKPIALMPTLIRGWEALRVPEVAKWQQKYRVDWDATNGRKG